MPPLSQVSKGGGDGNLISVFLGASAGAVCCFPGDAADVRAGQAEVAEVAVAERAQLCEGLEHVGSDACINVRLGGLVAHALLKNEKQPESR